MNGLQGFILGCAITAALFVVAIVTAMRRA